MVELFYDGIWQVSDDVAEVVGTDQSTVYRLESTVQLKREMLLEVLFKVTHL